MPPPDGNKHFGAIYTANALAEGAGSYAMATWLFSAVYEREIGQGSGGSASGSDGADGKDCYGRQCFLWTAWISAVLCAFSALLCVWLGAPQNPSCALALLRARAGQVGGRSHATTRCKARPIESFRDGEEGPQCTVFINEVLVCMSCRSLRSARPKLRRVDLRQQRVAERLRAHEERREDFLSATISLAS